MHTYKKSRDEPLWTVGYYRPFAGRSNGYADEWVPLSDHSTEWDAIKRVNFLNGGEYSAK